MTQLLWTGAATPAGCLSVWDHVILGLLFSRAMHESAGPVRGAARPGKRPRRAAYAPSSHVCVKVIERLSANSVAVSWQDATRCRYDEQVWISCRARLKGRCALSGAPIRRDDAIYKPRVRAAMPANAAAMILASVIERLPANAMAGESHELDL